MPSIDPEQAERVWSRVMHCNKSSPEIPVTRLCQQAGETYLLYRALCRTMPRSACVKTLLKRQKCTYQTLRALCCLQNEPIPKLPTVDPPQNTCRLVCMIYKMVSESAEEYTRLSSRYLVLQPIAATQKRACTELFSLLRCIV